MTPPRSDARPWWWVSLAYLLLLFAFAHFARAVVDFLRDREVLLPATLTAFSLAAVAVLVTVLRRRPGRREVAVLLGGVLVYGAVMLWMKQTEERIHLLQFGLLAWLVLGAVDRSWPEWSLGRRALVAIALGAAGGWADEIVQHFLPSRYYDLRDVGFNAIASVLAVAWSRAFAWAARGPRGPEVDPG